ncbi:MAG: cation transporter [Bacteroidales bacterium]|nr:cation transporter [Bacteroidales bacterium]
MKMLFCLMLGASALLSLNSQAVQAAPPKKDVKTVVFDVSVHCKSCKEKIERSVAFEKGIKEINASVDERTVTVRYDAAKTDTDKIAAAIRKLGYEVALHNPKAEHHRHGHGHSCADTCSGGHHHHHHHHH